MSSTKRSNFIRAQIRIRMWPTIKKIANYYMVVEEAKDVWEFEFILR